MQGRRKSIVVVVAALAVLALVAIGVGASVRGDGSLDTNSTSISESSSASTGEQLPDFRTTLADDGSTFTQADVKLPAVIHVYASWCEVCASEGPAFARLQREKPDLNYYLLDVQDTPAEGRTFMERFGWSANSVLLDDPRRAAESELGLTGQPNTLFVDEDGTISQALTGAAEADDLLSAAEQLT